MKKILSFLLVFLITTNAYASITLIDGRKTITTAGTAEALVSTETAYNEVTICAEGDNTGVIAVGQSPVAALATREGIYLDAGDCYTIDTKGQFTGDLRDIQLDTTVNGDGVTYTGWLGRIGEP